MSGVKLRFADLEVEFADREVAIKRIEEWAEKGTYPVKVIYGPEGCGKTALLRQTKAILEEHNYNVIYINPLAEEGRMLTYTSTIKDFVKEVLRAVPEPYSKVVDVAINIAGYIMKKLSKPRVAILMDDIFQAVGLDKAERYAKALLNLIEYPPGEYEKIVTIVTTSEGLSKRDIGRHRWANLLPLWNMSRDGFRQLYIQVPGDKPRFEDLWRLSGGNPAMLARLYETGWNADEVLKNVMREKHLISFVATLSSEEREILREALSDPDTLISKDGVKVLEKLIELNLIVDEIYFRDPELWVDIPPPEKDLELGIGRYVAWQTPLYREAVRKAIEQTAK